MRHLRGFGLIFLLSAETLSISAVEEVQTDLLIVGGTESGWAAAIQAARMGVASITIVLRGQARAWATSKRLRGSHQ